MTTARLLADALQIDFLQSRLYHIWKLQAAENRNNFSDNGKSRSISKLSCIFKDSPQIPKEEHLKKEKHQQKPHNIKWNEKMLFFFLEKHLGKHKQANIGVNTLVNQS